MGASPPAPADQRDDGAFMDFQRRIAPNTIAQLIIPLAALGLGMGVAVAPLPAAGAALGIAGLLWILSLGQRVQRLFLACLAGLLAGYAFFGRSFAYLGVPPLFLGEAVLGLGGIALLAAWPKARFGWVHGLVLVFGAWGILRTVPYLGTYGVDAVRDAVSWLYAVFALAVAATVRPHHFERVIGWYQRIIPIYLLWVPLAGIAVATLALPALPLANVPILSFKGGDAGIHLAAIAAFILVGLYGSARRVPSLPIATVWLQFMGAAGLVAVLNRGGMIAMATAGAALLFVRQAGRVVSLVFMGTLLFTALVAVDPKVEVPGNRPFSIGQVLDNITSIVGESNEAEIGGALQGSKSFRLRWWGTIVDYTVGGPFFWTGKGFGINLADDDGFQPTADGSLRAPHNGHVEVLARMGVPGIVLWILLNLAYAAALARAARRAQAGGRPEWVPVLAWLFVYWSATMVNASFDPYLQGPQGGIWFWSIMGLGLAAIHASEQPGPWASHSSDASVEPVEDVGAAKPRMDPGHP